MDLESLSKRSEQTGAVLDAARQKTNERAKAEQTAAERRHEIKELEKPVVQYARNLLSYTSELNNSKASFRYNRYTSPQARDSVLVRVGEVDKHKSYYVGVSENYIPSDYDGDGNPRGEHYLGMSFDASIGTVMTSSEYYALPDKERYSLSCLGATVDGKSVYGKVAVSESGFDEKHPNPSAATVERVRESVGSASETIELMRQSLADTKLNPRPRYNGGHIPVSLLPAPEKTT